MDFALNLLLRLFGLFFPTIIFAGIGWSTLKLVTLGRYPKFSRTSQDWHDFDAVAFLGVVETFLLLCAIAWLR
jgi:hypothetical protein